MPHGTAVHEIVNGLFCSSGALRKDKDLNFCLYQCVVQTRKNEKAPISRARLVREVVLSKLQTIDETLDSGTFVEQELQCFWGNKAAALYMQARPVYGLSGMPINDEFEHLVLMDVFISAYVMGRQEARRNWYERNPDVYRNDVKKTGNNVHMTAMQDDETI